MTNKNEAVNYVLVGLLVIGAYFLGAYKTKYDLLKTGQPIKNQAQQQRVKPKEKIKLSKEEWQEITKDPFAVKGKKDAPVTIVEFTDYQCPFCNRYVNEAYPEIIKNYVDKGKVRYILRNLPLPFHKYSKEAAIAAYCAGKQGKYWEMHDKLFSNQKEWETSSDAKKMFAKYGDQLGINIRSCQDDKGVKEAVGKDLELAKKIGADGTPTFFINGQKLVGAQPYSAFKSMIDEALKK